jgi:hypothetical protein
VSIAGTSGTPARLEYSIIGSVSSNWIFYPRADPVLQSLANPNKQATSKVNATAGFDREGKFHPVSTPGRRLLASEVSQIGASARHLLSPLTKTSNWHKVLSKLWENRDEIISAGTKIGSYMFSASEDENVYENSSTFRYMLGNIYLPEQLVDPNLISYRDQI